MICLSRLLRCFHTWIHLISLRSLTFCLPFCLNTISLSVRLKNQQISRIFVTSEPHTLLHKIDHRSRIPPRTIIWKSHSESAWIRGNITHNDQHLSPLLLLVIHHSYLGNRYHTGYYFVALILPHTNTNNVAHSVVHIETKSQRYFTHKVRWYDATPWEATKKNECRLW